MKLGIKLPLTFAISLALLFAGGLFGIYRLNGAVTAYETDVLQHVAAHKKAAEISAHFSVAIQEWKNVLLRGKDDKEAQKYWDAHEKAMQSVQKLLDELKAMNLDGEGKGAVDKVVAGMVQAREGYKKAFEDFKASGNDHIAGDKAARGKDREAATRLTELREVLSKEETQAADAAEATAGAATWAALSVMTVVMLLALIVSIYMSRRIVAHLQVAVTVAERVAHGDLTNQVDASGQDEIAMLLRALDEMQGQLIKLVTSVRHGAEGVADASSEIAHGNHDLSIRTEQQASAVQETASSMTQLGTAVSHSSDNARQASQLAANASSVAVRGGDVVNQVVTTMKDIDDSSHKISEIIGVIDGIAFQTNILALNAAVEAARAGEQGRGFAVVASEVRALAGRSADAAKEIKGLINASVERVEHGTALVAQAGETMQEVVTSIQRVTDIVSEISAAAAEQNSGVAQVGEAVHHIDETTQQNAALVEEMAAAASGLKSQSEELVRLVSAFKLNSADSVAKAAVRASPPKPFKGDDRRNMPSAPAPAPAAPPAASLAKPALRPAAPKPAAKPAPKPVAAAPAAPKQAAADEEWETF